MVLECSVSRARACAADDRHRVESERKSALQEDSVRLLIGVLQISHVLFTQKLAEVTKALS